MFNVQNFLDALPNIGLGYGGIFLVTAIVVGVVYLLNNVPEKFAEMKRKKKNTTNNYARKESIGVPILSFLKPAFNNLL